MQSSLICNSSASENIANWSRTRNFAVPQSGCQTMPSGSFFASRLKFSWALFSPNCSRCISITQTNASRVPIDGESAAHEAAAYAGGKDCKTAGAATATSARRRVFRGPVAPSPEVWFAIDRRAVRVPSPVRKFHQSVHDRVHTGRGRSGRRRSHFVARRAEQPEMVYPQKLRPVSWPDRWELREKLVALAAHY